MQKLSVPESLCEFTCILIDLGIIVNCDAYLMCCLIQTIKSNPKKIRPNPGHNDRKHNSEEDAPPARGCA